MAIAFKERITFLHELFGISSYFFLRPETYDDKVIKKRWTTTNVDFLTQFAGELKNSFESFDADAIKNTMQQILDRMEINTGSIMQVLRVAVTGVASGIDLFYTMELLGYKEVSERIEIAVNKLADFIK